MEIVVSILIWSIKIYYKIRPLSLKDIEKLLASQTCVSQWVNGMLVIISSLVHGLIFGIVKINIINHIYFLYSLEFTKFPWVILIKHVNLLLCSILAWLLQLGKTLFLAQAFSVLPRLESIRFSWFLFHHELFWMDKLSKRGSEMPESMEISSLDIITK